MIYLNCKYKTNDNFTGVDNVAEAYRLYLQKYFEVSEINYSCKETIKKNLEEQLFKNNNRFNKNDIVLHPTNTAPLRKLKCREILVLHDLAFIDYPNGFSNLFRRWYQFLIPRLLKSKDYIITVSEFSKKRIIEYYNINSEKVTVVSNGINEVKDYLNFNSYKPKHFLAVGSITERKNHECIIRAHRKLPLKIRESYPLKIVGGKSNYFNDGDIDNESDRYIHFLGYVKLSELEKLYINSLAYLSASRYEGYGLPIIEALSYGKHVICSDIPPHKEIVGNDYNHLFPCEDYDKLAELMENLTDNVEYFFLDKKAIKKRFSLARKYLWETTLIDLKNTIEKISRAS